MSCPTRPLSGLMVQRTKVRYKSEIQIIVDIFFQSALQSYRAPHAQVFSGVICRSVANASYLKDCKMISGDTLEEFESARLNSGSTCNKNAFSK